jgi:hypothetical protein
MLILPGSSPDIYHFLAEGRHCKQNIGLKSDSMAYSHLLGHMSMLAELIKAYTFTII